MGKLRANSSEVFTNSQRTALLLRYLKCRGFKKEDDLRKLDPARLDRLVPALDALLAVGGHWKKHLTSTVRSMQGKPLDQGFQNSVNEQYMAIVADANNGHYALCSAIGEAFPPIAVRPPDRNERNMLDPKIDSALLLHFLEETLISSPSTMQL